MTQSRSPLLVLINAKAGAPEPGRESVPEKIAEAFRDRGIDAAVKATPGSELTEAARRAVQSDRYTAIVAAGGDGTVSAVAQGVAGSGVTMGVLPQGTLNHFAKDLGIPLELEAAVATIVAGATRRVDVGEVNGRVFVNNSSIGLYPHMVSKRDRQIERLGRSKWLALLSASVATFRRHLNLHVRMNVRSGGRSFASGERSTPFVFVGNNAYAMDLLNLGKREAIDRGELCLYVTCRGGRLTMLALALRAIFGRLEQSRDFESVTGEEVLIDARKKTLRVSVDGEVERMTPPLDYRIRPGALTVFVPRTPGLGKPGA